jgi:hypothetical protein
MEQKRAVTGKLASRYRATRSRKERSRILDEVQELTGYDRHYAAYVLRNYGTRRVVTDVAGGSVVLVIGRKNKRRPTPRARRYGMAVQREIVFLWRYFDKLCGKRLVVLIADVISSLIEHGRVSDGGEVHQKLLQISASTVDRILKPERAKERLKGNTHTTPTQQLKSQIPIVISSELNREQPGHYQIDLVGHDGGNPNGHFAFSLCAIELSSGWVEPQPMLNKAQSWTLKALQRVTQLSPMPVRSLHSDNDSAFLNHLLQSWCAQNAIPYSRGRPYHSNDTCYVEQKNFNLIRQAVGYARFETEEELALIGQLYDKLRLLVNFFYPSVKLLSKERIHGRIRKSYDAPKSPCRRLLDNPQLSTVIKIKLRHQRRALDPLTLKDDIVRMQDKLLELVRRKNLQILYPGPPDPKAREKMRRHLFGATSGGV